MPTSTVPIFYPPRLFLRPPLYPSAQERHEQAQFDCDHQLPGILPVRISPTRSRAEETPEGYGGTCLGEVMIRAYGVRAQVIGWFWMLIPNRRRTPAGIGMEHIDIFPL